MSQGEGASSESAPVIVWFRDDLRLADNPALLAAIACGKPVLCIYIHDQSSAGLRPVGGASRWWLANSLDALARDLARLGARLDILQGSAARLVHDLATNCGATHVFWNRRYGAAEMAVDTGIKSQLLASGIHASSFNSHLLSEPWEIRNKTGGEFKVFTPFWRACLAARHWPAPQAAPAAIPAAPPLQGNITPVPLKSLRLMPTRPDWSAGLAGTWQPGEAGALAKLEQFIDHGLDNYGIDRNRPDLPKTSGLSPHLRFGEVSPRQIVQAIEHATASGRAKQDDADKFLSEIGWREFSYHLLFHHTQLATRNFSPRFDAFPWIAPEPKLLRAWQRGQTGYPIVDAGMRQLWQTGTMHNRVRMIVASFLTKHLMIDWRIGEAWFWDTLCDADPANNPASWQWVAGSGADAAPYFRIFNPVLQGEKYDPEGQYVRKFVPELADLPQKFVHQPWTAPAPILHRAKVRLGLDYPEPIVDHAQARESALKAFATLSPKVGP